VGLNADKSLISSNSKENVSFRNTFYLSNKFVKCDNVLKSLLSSSFFTGNINENYHDIDILTIKTISNFKSLLKKYNGKKLGIEFLISDIKYYDNNSIGKWLFDMKWIYELCKKYDSQFILSSGACRFHELVSLKIFNILLEKIGIQTKKYWQELSTWLNDKQVVFSYYDSNKKKI
jgi:integrase